MSPIEDTGNLENVDPLWVIDLSDPTNPVILGELEVPGVSTYIHPVNENTLLTIGIGPGEDGLGLDWSTTQISLFDISDPTNPTLADSLPFPLSMSMRIVRMSGVAGGRGHGPKLLMSTRHSPTGLLTIFSQFLFPHTGTSMIRMMDMGAMSMFQCLNW